MILKIIEDMFKTELYDFGFTGTLSSAIRHISASAGSDQWNLSAFEMR